MQRVRYSKTMMVVGEATVVVAGAAAIVGLEQLLGQLFEGATCGAYNFSSAGSNCSGRADDSFAGPFMLAVVLASAGIPMIVTGSRMVRAAPKSSTTMSPWVGRQSAGFSLRLEL
jgi:hypothetical protein